MLGRAFIIRALWELGLALWYKEAICDDHIYLLVCLFVYWYYMTCNLLYRPGWSQSQRSPYFCIQVLGRKALQSRGHSMHASEGSSWFGDPSVLLSPGWENRAF